MYTGLGRLISEGPWVSEILLIITILTVDSSELITGVLDPAPSKSSIKVLSSRIDREILFWISSSW